LVQLITVEIIYYSNLFIQMGTIRNLIRPNGQYMGQNDKREMQYGLPEFGNQTFIPSQ
tara:strand:+ start:157 stop:330 length:174 start_codon:yes stop_codon:yes gene_type:complete